MPKHHHSEPTAPIVTIEPQEYGANSYYQSQPDQQQQQYFYQQQQPHASTQLPNPLFKLFIQVEQVDPSTYQITETRPQQLSQCISQDEFQNLISRARLLKATETNPNISQRSTKSTKYRIALFICISLWIVCLLVSAGMIGAGIFGIVNTLKVGGLIALLPIGINAAVWSSIIFIVILIVIVIAGHRSSRPQSYNDFIKQMARQYSFKHLMIRSELWPNTMKTALTFTLYPNGTSPYLIMPQEVNSYTNQSTSGSGYVRF
jgi:hypothetical protein